MVAFIDGHKRAFGVESICRQLPIAPSSYYERKARQRDPGRLPARQRRDARLREEVRRVFEGSRGRSGARKVWRQLQRDGVQVARCTPSAPHAPGGPSGREARRRQAHHRSR